MMPSSKGHRRCSTSPTPSQSSFWAVPLGTVRDAAAVALAILTLALVAGVGVAGCASTGGLTRGSAASLADAGQRYSESLDRLLTTAGRVQVDATSQRLIHDDRLHNLTLEQYRAAAREDRRRLEVLTRLQRHGRLLESYFRLLGDLTHGASAKRAAEEMQQVTASLAELGGVLRPELGAEALADRTAGAVTRTGTRLLRRIDARRVRRELRARTPIITRELATQELLLEMLADDLRHDLAVVAGHREQALVIDPLLDDRPLAEPAGWMERRRRLVTSRLSAAGPAADPALEDLSQAAAAARALSAAFQGVGRGTANGDLDTALARLGTALDTVDAVAAEPASALAAHAPTPKGDS